MQELHTNLILKSQIVAPVNLLSTHVILRQSYSRANEYLPVSKQENFKAKRSYPGLLESFKRTDIVLGSTVPAPIAIYNYCD